MANHVHAYRSVIVHGLLSLHCIVESLPLAHNAQHCPSIHVGCLVAVPYRVPVVTVRGAGGWAPWRGHVSLYNSVPVNRDFLN